MVYISFIIILFVGFPLLWINDTLRAIRDRLPDQPKEGGK